METCVVTLLIVIAAVVLVVFRDQIRTAVLSQSIDDDDKAVHRPTKRGPTSSAPVSHLQWLGYNTALHVHGIEITHPMTYASDAHGYVNDPSEIDRTLPVQHDAAAEDLPYWPWYSRMSPGQRSIYLRWLASGRQTLPPGDGYLFVYYYGLERRAIADDTDHKLVFREVQRLRRVYERFSDNKKRSSFMQYSSSFLWLLAATKPQEIRLERVQELARRTAAWNEEKLAAALAWLHSRQLPLPAWLAFVVAEQSPQSQHSVVIKRVGDDFRSLFVKRYCEQFGDGITLRVAKRQRPITYKAATAAIDYATAEVPNVLGIPSQFKKLSSLWNGCVEDLKTLSQVSRVKTGAPLTAEAWEAMPEELRRCVEHPHNDAICKLVADSADEADHVYVSAAALAGAVGLPSRDRYPIAECRKLASIAGHVGFAVEPDPRLTGRAYTAGDQLTIFPQIYEGDPDYRRYGAAACMMRLGVAVAEADGEVDQGELDCIRDQIEDAFELNEHEQRRLHALEMLLIRTGADVTGLGKRLREVVGELGRLSIGRLLVAVAAADGVITKGERKALAKCYRTLGLSVDKLDTTLAEFDLGDKEEPVVVRTDKPGRKGERLPKRPDEEVSVRLDREAISRIMHETREVSALLVEAMQADGNGGSGAAGFGTAELATPASIERAKTGPAEAQPASDVKPAPMHLDVAANPPPARYADFVADLLVKPQWSKEDAEALARRHGHMLSGAIEAINEWAYDQLGEQLVFDDHDALEVQADLMKGS